MPRERLTLEALVTEHRFDPANHRHRSALDESGPLEDLQLEAARELALSFRRRLKWDGRGRGPEALQAFADLVNR